ncbi:reverse transcriptase domain-containing protein [Tanacetum coccineum]
MSPPIRRKYHDSVSFEIGCKKIKNCKRCNRKIRIPIGMWPCKVEEKMTLKEVDGKMVEEIETKIIAKDGTPEGNMNGWLMEDEEELERNEVDSDLESTASSKPMWKKTTKDDPDRAYDRKGGAIALTRWIKKMENMIDNSGCVENQKALLVEEFCPSNEMERLENEFWNHKMVGSNHAAYTDQFHELSKLVPHLVTPESVRIKRYVAGLALEIRGMLKATQPTTIQNAILRASILTDEAISCGTLSKSNEKRKAVEETSKSGGSWKENKKEKVGTGFVATTPHRNKFVGSNPRCTKCYTHHPENGYCRLCFNCQKPGHFAKDYWAPFRPVALVSAVRMGNNPRVCYECGSPNHFCNNCPKLYRAPGQAGNQLAVN